MARRLRSIRVRSAVVLRSEDHKLQAVQSRALAFGTMAQTHEGTCRDDEYEQDGAASRGSMEETTTAYFHDYAFRHVVMCTGVLFVRVPRRPRSASR